MIAITNREITSVDFEDSFDKNSIELKIINILSSSKHQYTYSSLNELEFELKLRKEIINASYKLNQSGLNFDVFHKTKCNKAYWTRAQDGGFVLNKDVKPSNAIMDIYYSGYKYSTECATAMMIVYYKALLETYSPSLFNKIFINITLMNWHKIDPLLYEVGSMEPREDYLPGDRRYFINPDVNPLTPEWQGENVIYLDNNLYYGHDIGICNANEIIQTLNKHRSEEADESAVLMNSAGRPNFKKLEYIYRYYSQ